MPRSQMHLFGLQWKYFVSQSICVYLPDKNICNLMNLRSPKTSANGCSTSVMPLIPSPTTMARSAYPRVRQPSLFYIWFGNLFTLQVSAFRHSRAMSATWLQESTPMSFSSLDFQKKMSESISVNGLYYALKIQQSIRSTIWFCSVYRRKRRNTSV